MGIRMKISHKYGFMGRSIASLNGPHTVTGPLFKIFLLIIFYVILKKKQYFMLESLYFHLSLT